MTFCPHCDSKNIEGVDVCDECGQSLGDQYLLEPATAVEGHLLRDRLRDLSPRAPLCVPHTTSVRDVYKFLIEKKIGCVFVTSGDEVVGVFTERDAYKRLGAEASEHFHRPISDFMTADPQTLRGDTKVAFAVRAMDQGGFRHLLVLDEDGKPTGVISVRDILRYLTTHLSGADAG